MMQFQAQAKSFTDAETMAAAYLAQYYGNKKVEYPINPFQMLKDEGSIDDQNRYLESLKSIMKYDQWFYGHLHDNRRVFETTFFYTNRLPGSIKG